jgi:hypothetical protein
MSVGAGDAHQEELQTFRLALNLTEIRDRTISEKFCESRAAMGNSCGKDVEWPFNGNC